MSAAESATNIAETAAGAASAVPSYSWTGYFMGIALMFVMLGLLWFGARLMKQRGGLRFLGVAPGFNVESRLSLGPRKHIIVVRYRGKRLLLGVTDHNINLLSEEPLPDGEEAEEATLASTGEAGGISGKFKDMLHELNRRK